MSDSSSALAKREPSNGDSSSGPSIFESRRFQQDAVLVTLVLLLESIDECRVLLNESQSQSRTSPSLVLEFGKRLTARERKELDTAVDNYRGDLGQELEQEYQRLKQNIKETQAHKTGVLYPLSPEAEALAFGLIFRGVRSKAFDANFSQYQDSYASIEYIENRIRSGTASSKTATLGTAILPLIVSKAEEFLAGLIRAGLTLFPHALGEPPNIPNDVLLRYQRNISSADIHRWQVDQQVAGFMRQSPSDWCKAVERWTKIDPAKLGADWDMVQEMIQRRHVIIHNGGRVDREYLDRVASRLRTGVYLGSTLICDLAYLEPVMVELETWAVCLAVRWDKHFFKKPANYRNLVIDRVVRLEGSGRWTQALAILDSYLKKPLPTDTQDVIIAKINQWFCIQELGRDNASVQQEVRAWQLEDSADPDDVDYVEIGRRALLRDYDGLIGAVESYLSRDESRMTKRDFAEMPLMKRAMRESRSVRTFMSSSAATTGSRRLSLGSGAGGRKQQRRGRRR